jgi:hypothetical protein
MAVYSVAAKVNLTVPGQGPYKVWTEANLPTVPPDKAALVEANPFSVDLPATGYLAVYDTVSGNLAIKPVKGLKGSLSLSEADFGLVAETDVIIQHDGKAVQSATVTLIDSARTQTATLDPSLAGKLVFYGVKQGHVELKVQYVSNGKQVEPLDLVSELQHQRKDKAVTIDAVITDDVATVNPAASKTSTTPGEIDQTTGATPPKGPATVGTVVGKTVTIVLGLVVVAAIIAGASEGDIG